MKLLFQAEVNNLSELQELLRKANKQSEDLKYTLKKIDDFELQFVNKKSEFNKNSDHKKKN